jgi:hypothetical protein
MKWMLKFFVLALKFTVWYHSNLMAAIRQREAQSLNLFLKVRFCNSASECSVRDCSIQNLGQNSGKTKSSSHPRE